VRVAHPQRHKPHLFRLNGKWRVIRANTAGMRLGMRLHRQKKNRAAKEWARMRNQRPLCLCFYCSL
jgi:hypothetical protein